MKQKHFLYIFLLSPLFFLFSCDGETLELPPPEAQIKFQPLAVGNYIDYQVYDTLYIGADEREDFEIEVTTYQLRELISERLSENSSGLRYRLERFKRQDESQLWKLDSIWTIRLQDSSIIKVENNVPFIKLVPNMQANTTWDGNSFNKLPAENYNIGFYLEDYQVLDDNYPNSIEVIHRFDSTFLKILIGIEVYAEDVGLVYKRTDNINLCNVPCFPKAIPISGNRVVQKIIARGKL